MSCSPLTLEQVQKLLAEAQSAYHELMTGTAIAEMVDSNGERVRYNQANKNSLYQYIVGLQNQLALLSPSACVTPRVMGPMGAFF